MENAGVLSMSEMQLSIVYLACLQQGNKDLAEVYKDALEKKQAQVIRA